MNTRSAPLLPSEEAPTPDGSGPSDPPEGSFERVRRRVRALAVAPRAERALEALAFCNASLLPVPVETLLVPLVAARPSRAVRLGTLATLASGIGIVYGYALGHFAARVLPAVLSAIGQDEVLDHALRLLHGHGPELVLVAAFAPVPFVMLTVGAGLSGYGLVAFLPLALAGRGLRVALVGALVATATPHFRSAAAPSP